MGANNRPTEAGYVISEAPKLDKKVKKTTKVTV